MVQLGVCRSVGRDHDDDDDGWTGVRQDAKGIAGGVQNGKSKSVESPEPAGTPPWGRAFLRRRTGRDSR